MKFLEVTPMVKCYGKKGAENLEVSCDNVFLNVSHIVAVTPVYDELDWTDGISEVIHHLDQSFVKLSSPIRISDKIIAVSDVRVIGGPHKIAEEIKKLKG